MNETLTLVLVGIAFALALFPIFLLLLRRNTDTLSNDDDNDSPEPILGEMTGPLAAQIPVSRGGREDLQKLLQAAGYYRSGSLMEYRAVRTVLVIAPLLVAGAVALLVQPIYAQRVVIVGLLLAVLGFSLPRFFIAMHRRARAREISRGLPLAIDLLSLCLTAGQNLLTAFGQVAKEMRFSNPVLAQELAITQKQAELHSTEVAMKQWADRVQVPEVSSLASALTQSERLGTDTSTTLNELATNFRMTARQRAEEHANKTSFWMLFPSVFCFWVASAIVLIAPAYLEFFEYRNRDGAKLADQTRQNIERANIRQQPPFDPLNPPPVSP